MSKEQIFTGHVEGFGATFRDETPQETLIRETRLRGADDGDIEGVKLFAKIIDTSIIGKRHA